MEKIKLHEIWEDRDYYTECYCYLIKKLPKLNEYFDYGDDKGYVLSIIEEEKILEKDYKKYTIYYEKNLGDWNNQIIDVADACYVCIKSRG